MRAFLGLNDKAEKGNFTRFLWVYMPFSEPKVMNTILSQLKAKLSKNAINGALLGRLELECQNTGYKFNYAQIKEPSLLANARLRESKSRLIWVPPSINHFNASSQDAAGRFVKSSVKQKQLYRAMEPLFKHARHIDDYNAIAWYLATRESLERLLEQPLNVIPISPTHPLAKKCLKQSMHDAKHPRGCAPISQVSGLNIHPFIKPQIIDLLASIKQLTDEPMTHSRIRDAVLHTRNKAKNNVLAILSSQHKNHSPAVSDANRTHPQQDVAINHTEKAANLYKSIDTYI
jgi:hypothetical protein